MPSPKENQNVAPQQNPDVMGALRQERTPAKRMEVVDILAKSLEGSDENPIDYYNELASMVNENPKFRVMRAGNTLFSYEIVGPGEVDVSMDTADSPRELVNSIKEFTKAMKVAGFKTFNADIDNPQILKIFDMTGIKYNLGQTNILLPDGKTPQMSAKGEF